MSRVFTSYREPAGITTFVSTEKEVLPQGSDEEMAYWMLAKRVSKTFGDLPVTVAEIYHKVTGPLGLSSDETSQLVKNAKKMGYIRSA